MSSNRSGERPVPPRSGGARAAFRSGWSWPWPRALLKRALRSSRWLAAVFTAAFITAAAVAMAQKTGEAEGTDLRYAAAAVAARAGFTVAEVFIIGRQDTPKADIAEAMGVERGMPILALDLDVMRDRLLALPWVREASIERQLPDTLLVQISERRPIALWQNRGQFAVIDERGEVLASGDCSAFTHLPLVVGDDAPRHAAALVRMLASEPELAQRVKAAVRVGSRRWDIALAGDIDVRLPERDAEMAWRRLADYQRQHRLLDKPIAAVDLRLPDRIGVKPSAGVPQPGAVGRGRDA